MRDHLFTLTFLLLLCLAGSTAVAQVTSQRQSMSRGNNDALILELPSADDKMVEKLWVDWLKDEYKVKTKRNRKSKEYESLNFGIPGVSTGGKVDMYSTVDERGSGTEITVWIATPDGYISPELDRNRYYKAEEMLMRFALEVSREQIEEQVELEEDALKDLEKELEKLQKDEEDANDDIREAEKKIQEAEEAIRQAQQEQQAKRREIEEQIRVVENTKRRLKDFK